MISSHHLSQETMNPSLTVYFQLTLQLLECSFTEFAGPLAPPERDGEKNSNKSKYRKFLPQDASRMPPASLWTEFTGSSATRSIVEIDEVRPTHRTRRRAPRRRLPNSERSEQQKQSVSIKRANISTKAPRACTARRQAVRALAGATKGYVGVPRRQDGTGVGERHASD